MKDFTTTPDIIGKKVLIRGRNSGVQFGTLKQYVLHDGYAAVELSDSIRLWFWSGAASLSQLAVTGPKKQSECKFSVTVPSLVVIDVIEIIPCTEEAIKVIEAVQTWKI